MSIWSREPCKLCLGTGELGKLAGHVIICEGCERTGWRWVERAAILPPEKI